MSKKTSKKPVTIEETVIPCNLCSECMPKTMRCLTV